MNTEPCETMVVSCVLANDRNGFTRVSATIPTYYRYIEFGYRNGWPGYLCHTENRRGRGKWITAY